MAIIRNSQSVASRYQFIADFHMAEETWTKLHHYHRPDDFPYVHDALGNVPASVLAMGMVCKTAKYAAIHIWSHHFCLYTMDHLNGSPSIIEE